MYAGMGGSMYASMETPGPDNKPLFHIGGSSQFPYGAMNSQKTDYLSRVQSVLEPNRPKYEINGNEQLAKEGLSELVGYKGLNKDSNPEKLGTYTPLSKDVSNLLLTPLGRDYNKRVC